MSNWNSHRGDSRLEAFTGLEKVAMVVFGISALVGAAWVGDKLDPFTEEADISITTEPTLNPRITTAPTSTALANDYDTIPGLSCGTGEQQIILDEGDRIGFTISLLKGIETAIPGSQATRLNQVSVYPFARKIAERNSLARPELAELDTNEELDNFPLGPLNIPVGCVGLDSDGLQIKVS
jgi:hypothetical protein